MQRGVRRGSVLVWGEAALCPGEHLVVADAKRLDPPLLAEGQADKEAKLHQLGVGELRVQSLPKRVIRQSGIPDDCAGIGERGLFALAKLVRILEIEQFGVLSLRDASRSRPDRSLHPSVLALDGLRDIDAAEFLDIVVEHTFAKCGLPGL